LAKCRHPHVIRVDRVFQEAGLWARVMEFVAGESLEDYILARGCLAEDEAIEIITKVGDAVSYVHAQELLHQDIKPANILIRSNG
jgi:eukaryotic-like serine/threonine-protein kinase